MSFNTIEKRRCFALARKKGLGIYTSENGSWIITLPDTTPLKVGSDVCLAKFVMGY